MTTEPATYISQLDPSKPGEDDSVGFGNNHLQLIKQAIQNTFVGTDGDRYDTDVTIGPRALARISGDLDNSDLMTTNTNQTVTGEKTFEAPITCSAVIQAPGETHLISQILGNAIVVGDQGNPTFINAVTGDDLKLSTPSNAPSTILHENNARDFIVDIFAPVGIIMMFGDETDPNNLYPNTVWWRIEEGVVPVTAGSNEDRGETTRFFSLGKNEGYFSQKIAPDQLPDIDQGSNVAPPGGSNNYMGVMSDQYRAAQRALDNMPPTWGVRLWARVQ